MCNPRSCLGTPRSHQAQAFLGVRCSMGTRGSAFRVYCQYAKAMVCIPGNFCHITGVSNLETLSKTRSEVTKVLFKS